MDLYGVLGVSKEASREEIKKAYKSKAREHHPDAGGKTEDMSDVNMAYDVLSDDKKRKEYDATGEIGEIDKELAAMRQILFAIFEQVYLQGSGTLEDVSIKLIRNARQNTSQEEKELDKQIQKLKDGLEDIIEEPDPPLLRGFLEQHLAQAMNNREEIKVRVIVINKLEELLKSYKMKKRENKTVKMGGEESLSEIFKRMMNGNPYDL